MEPLEIVDKRICMLMQKENFKQSQNGRIFSFFCNDLEGGGGLRALHVHLRSMTLKFNKQRKGKLVIRKRKSSL